VIDILRTAGRVLRMHWPALLAWYVAGTLAWYASIELAGFVGAYNALAGTLLLPISILCRLVPFVAMLLVVRDGMRSLRSVETLPTDRQSRRTSFVDALLAGILPFFAFYAAWGFLRDDASAYFSRVLEVNQGLIWEPAGDGAVGELVLGPLTIALIVVAFVLRWLLARYRPRLPKFFAIFAAYLEALWVYLTIVLLSQAIDLVTAWVAGRQAMVWLADLRETIAEGFAPLAFVWDGVEWLLGEAGGIILLPIAWLTIAGVVYGQAVAPERLSVKIAALDSIRSRYLGLPARARSRLHDLWTSLTARFRPIGAALVLMWRAGPALVGSYVLIYTVLLAVENLLAVAATRIVGPHELEFWLANMALVTLAVPFVIEPLRVSIVAGAYDAVVGNLTPRPTDGNAPDAPLLDGEPVTADPVTTDPLTAPPADGQDPAIPRPS